MATPSTPKRKRPAESSNGEEDGNPSPRKTRAPRGTPTKAEERKAVAAAKAERKEAWALWCSQNVWEPNPAYRQRVGSIEMHRTDAMKYYCLTAEEMATLPYFSFENDNHEQAPPGKSYAVAGLEKLAHRKFAMLNIGHPPDASSATEAQFLRDGKNLFDDHINKLNERSKSPRRKKTWRVIRVPIQRLP
ncbi:hypothetical protein B0H16DRAFT_1513817 [Mycena metata]|uniref:Uncharacterized protein n=1 Tax=Mycena metata TaxID=1033252 RepID=A0AAD7JTL5_9AGAR|nr:hypothetical protein B0H16DRAFT_1513817 [Mycena metata]